MLYKTPLERPTKHFLGIYTIPMNESEEMIYEINGIVIDDEICIFYIDDNGEEINLGALQYEALRTVTAGIRQARIEKQELSSTDNILDNKS